MAIKKFLTVDLSEMDAIADIVACEDSRRLKTLSAFYLDICYNKNSFEEIRSTERLVQHSKQSKASPLIPTKSSENRI